MLDWPTDLPQPFAGGYAPFVRSLSGGQSLSGFEQVQPQLHDRWSASFSFHLGTDARILAARSLLTRLRGRANSVALPAFDGSRAPWSLTIASPSFFRHWPAVAGTAYEYEPLDGISGTATLTGANGFSFVSTGADDPEAGQAVEIGGVKRALLAVTGSGPFQCEFQPYLSFVGAVPALVTASVQSAASLNATSIDVAIATGAAPQPGHLFSLGNRLHAIDSLAALGSSVYRLAIWPWLRADVAAATVADFTTPRCEMRLASDAEGAEALRLLSLGRFGDMTLRFDEVS